MGFVQDILMTLCGMQLLSSERLLIIYPLHVGAVIILLLSHLQCSAFMIALYRNNSIFTLNIYDTKPLIIKIGYQINFKSVPNQDSMLAS